MAESFFNLLKRERIRRKVYRSRDEARQDVFDYIEMFYNPKRKHVRNGMLSPVEFEKQQKTQPEGAYETRRYSAGSLDWSSPQTSSYPHVPPIRSVLHTPSLTAFLPAQRAQS